MIGIGGNMNNRGQALIEFVLILPVFIFILFAIIDFGRIFNTKSEVDNDSVEIVNLYKNGMEIEEIKKIYSDEEIKISIEEEYSKISISTSIKLITPGLSNVLGNPYLINIERVVPNV